VSASTGRRILINQSYRMQRITGQQRYATEISSRLLDRGGYGELAPSGFWAASSLRVWVWLQVVLPFLQSRSLLVSMTARAPLVRRRQVLVVHDLFVLTNPEWFSRKYIVTHAPLLRHQIRRAAAIVAVSDPVAAELTPRYSGRIVVAPNAPSDVFSEPPADAAAAITALESRTLTAGTYFLAVGSIDPRKNLPALAAAWATIPPEQRQAHPLVIVGGGSAVFKSESIDWPSGTVDAGYVTDGELRDLYAGSLAVVFASKAEGFGLPLVEAAAAGATSLVISDLPVFRWICGDNAHYVDPLSVESIAQGLENALLTPSGIDIDLSRFGWDSSAAIVDDLCRSLEADRG
jgi:glycosyltransferase involved in cell wall biosynthesis